LILKRKTVIKGRFVLLIAYPHFLQVWPKTRPGPLALNVARQGLKPGPAGGHTHCIT